MYLHVLLEKFISFYYYLFSHASYRSIKKLIVYHLNILFYIYFADVDLEVGFSTKALVNKLISSREVENHTVDEFFNGVRIFHTTAFNYGLNHLPHNDELVINAQLVNFEM